MGMIFENTAYANWLRAQVGKPYWYGTTYVPCTSGLLNSKARQYPSHYTTGRMSRYRDDIAKKKICADCVGGAVKGAAWTDLGTHPMRYRSNGVPDQSADGMFSWCKAQGAEWGTIGSIPDVPGVAVRYAGHVGVYVGNGEVVEWRGFAYGCVLTKLKARKWTHWYRLPWVGYAGATGTAAGAVAAGAITGAAATLGARLLKRGSKGEDVRMLQQLLNAHGFDCGAVDGDFGAKTEAAVTALQRAAGLTADGQYGEKSHKALMAMAADLAAHDEEDEPEAAGSGRTVRVTAAVSANIRNGAGTQYKILTCAARGTELAYVGTAENGWIGVRLEGATGWISPKMAEVH